MLANSTFINKFYVFKLAFYTNKIYENWNNVVTFCFWLGFYWNVFKDLNFYLRGPKRGKLKHRTTQENFHDIFLILYPPDRRKIALSLAIIHDFDSEAHSSSFLQNFDLSPLGPLKPLRLEKRPKGTAWYKGIITTDSLH